MYGTWVRLLKSENRNRVKGFTEWRRKVRQPEGPPDFSGEKDEHKPWLAWLRGLGVILQRVAVLVPGPGWGICLGCITGLVPGRGACKRQPIDISLSHRCFPFSLSPPLSK